MKNRKNLYVLGGIALLAIIPLIAKTIDNGYLQTLTFFVMMFVSMSVAWNIIGGYAGQISFGHGTFWGLGAFTTAIFAIRTGLPAWLAMPIGGLVAMLYGMSWGYPTLRLRGPYFAIATIGIGEATRLIMLNLDQLLKNSPLDWLVKDKPFTGGASGLILPSPNDFQANQLLLFYICLGFMILTIAISAWINNSRFGLALRAVNMDQEAAETLGVSASRYKVLALMVTAFLVGVAGSLYAQYVLFIDAREVFSFSNSIAMVLMPTVGGIGTLWGPALGALVFKVADDRLSSARFMLGGMQINLGDVNLMLYGLLLVLIILFEPGGVLGLLKRLRKK